MPKKSARRVSYESDLARRIQYEREKRDMTYERLAQRMTDAGCTMQATTIYKIEKGDPPRRITVDEFLVFADVFDLTPDELLLSPPEALTAELRALVRDHYEAVKEWRPYWRRVLSTKAALADRIRDDPDAAAALTPVLRERMSERTAEILARELHWASGGK